VRRRISPVNPPATIDPMKYSLRSLMILVLVGLPLLFCALAIWAYVLVASGYKNAPTQVLKP
jgi:hypothetical protein